MAGSAEEPLVKQDKTVGWMDVAAAFAWEAGVVLFGVPDLARWVMLLRSFGSLRLLSPGFKVFPHRGLWKKEFRV